MEFLAGLPTVSAGILVLIFILIVFQEAVNGFHDTANAVATVIYSNAMKAGPAVALAAFMNFLGVLAGGTAVAFGLVYMLPNRNDRGHQHHRRDRALPGAHRDGPRVELRHLVAGHAELDHAHLHRLDHRSCDGARVCQGTTGARADQLAPGTEDPRHARGLASRGVLPGFRPAEADSPLCERSRNVPPRASITSATRTGTRGIRTRPRRRWRELPSPEIASQPETRPPAAIRAGLIAGSAGVAFLHGSNDGQKSIGLMMLVLFALAPLSYGLNSSRLNEAGIQEGMTALQQVEPIAAQFASDPVIGKGAQRVLDETRDLLALVKTRECADPGNQQSAACAKMREGLLGLHQTISRAIKQGESSGKFTSAAGRAVDQCAQRPGPVHPVRAFLGDFSVGPCPGTRHGLRLREDRDDAWREDGQLPHESGPGNGGSGERDRSASDWRTSAGCR